MSVISIDANQLKTAAPRVADLYTTLLGAARGVGALNTAGLPGPIAGRAQAAISAAAGKLNRAAAGLVGTSADLLRRAGLAEAADQISKLSTITNAPGLTAGLIQRAHELGGYGVPDNVGRIAGSAGYGLSVAGLALGVGVPTAHDLANPYLDDDRRVANGLARITTTGGMMVAGGIIIGAMSGALLPIAVAAGVGLAFGVLDQKLHITDTLADGIDWATDQTSAAADAVTDGVSGAVDAIGGLF